VGGARDHCVTAATANAAIQALVVGLSGGPPGFGIDEFQTIANAFVLTAPLAIAVTLVVFAFFRNDVKDDQWPWALVWVAVPIVPGFGRRQRSLPMVVLCDAYSRCQ